MSLLKQLPDHELFAYLSKCFAGRAMEYVSNSVYSVCLLAAQVHAALTTAVLTLAVLTATVLSMAILTMAVLTVLTMAVLTLAQRIFDKEQFLVLKFEDLMSMKAPGLLRLLSNFTGLHTDENIIRKVRNARECEAGSARKIPLSFAKSNNSKSAHAKAELEELRPELRDFYRPYNRMLEELVHPQFAWDMSGASGH